MKKYFKSTGFTIVELLIVIVVIGILASIVYVSYQGVQVNAKSNAAKATATALQHKIEAYGSVKGAFPGDTTAASYTTDLNQLPDSSITSAGIIIGTPDQTNGQNTVQLEYCATPAVMTTGAYRISYWDFNAHTLASTTITGTLSTTACDNWQVLS